MTALVFCHNDVLRNINAVFSRRSLLSELLAHFGAFPEKLPNNFPLVLN